MALAACGSAPPAAPIANRAAREGPAYAELFAPGAAWQLPCQVRGYGPGHGNGRGGIVATSTLHCGVAQAEVLAAARLAHLVCDDGNWIDAQLTGWYLADARGMWKLDNETSPMDLPIAPGGDPDAPRRITAADVPRLRADHMLLGAAPDARTIDDRSMGEGMRIIIDTPIGAAWCVRQVSSYGGAPRWRTFCYRAGAGLVGASQADGEAEREERCGMAPFAEFPLPAR